VKHPWSYRKKILGALAAVIPLSLIGGVCAIIGGRVGPNAFTYIAYGLIPTALLYEKWHIPAKLSLFYTANAASVALFLLLQAIYYYVFIAVAGYVIGLLTRSSNK
jgi:hypothetical protein